MNVLKSNLIENKKYKNLRKRAESWLCNYQIQEDITYSQPDNLKLIHELKLHQIELELQNQELLESRDQTELALARYFELYDSAIFGYFTLNNKSDIKLTNITGASVFGFKKTEMLGRRFGDFIIDKDQRSRFQQFLANIFDKQQKDSCNIITEKKDKTLMHLKIEGTTFNHAQECRLVVQDVTEQVKSDKIARQHLLELKQVMRSNSLGELASAIAHEVNQPLSTIINYVNGCIYRIECNNYDISEILKVMRIVLKQVKQSGDIIHHMKDLMRQDNTSYHLEDINQIAQSTILQFNELNNDNNPIPIKLDLAANLPKMKVNSIQIEIVILNLLRNAFDAIQKGNIDKPMLLLRTESIGQKIIVSVINNGPHYSDQEYVHLFEPFFTTKKKRMGLGLSICKTIIDAHYGKLTSHKISPAGVCFQFSLPIHIAS